MPALSLLICHLPARARYLDRLLRDLRPQLRPEVELRIDHEDGTVGAKRNRLLQAATGDYTAFIDDDDRVTPYYVESLLRALRESPDCCSLRGLITWNGESPRLFEHSLRHNAWYEAHFFYCRPPNHLNAIRRDLAQRITFPDANFGEDKAWADGILPLLTTEAFIEALLYRYEVREPKEC